LRRPLRTFFDLLASLRERVDWRCTRCGAGLLFGRREQCRAFYVRSAGYLALKQAKIRRQLPRLRLMERLPDAVMLSGLVLFGFWAQDLLVAASTGTPRVSVPERAATVIVTARAPLPEPPPVPVDPSPSADSAPAASRLSANVNLVEAELADVQPVAAIVPVAAVETPPAAPLQRPASPRDPVLAGTWGPDASACDKKSSARTGMIPMAISTRGARAGDTTCTFSNLRQSGSTWDVVATCGKGRERWTSKVRLTMRGDRLNWSSKKGVSAYVRCDRLMVAGR
jgi:hypothetical protein